MENQEIKNHKQGKYRFFPVFMVVAVLLSVTLTVFVGVSTINKIKEGEYIGQDIETKRTITVSDKGEIYAKPDLAIVNFSVTNEAKTVAEAMAENTKAMNTVIDAMKKEGIESKDLKTVGFNIYPRYEYYEKSVLYPTGKRVLAGYEVIQSLEVKIRDMGKIGKIVEVATQAGANEVGNLTFTIDKQDELKAKAREEAIKKAKDKAEELASQLGVGLVRITAFSESSQLPIYRDFEYYEKAAIGGAAPVPQIETGENKIEVTVSITYEIH